MQRKSLIHKNKKVLTLIASVIGIITLVIVFAGGLFDSDESKPEASSNTKISQEMLTKIAALAYVNQPINVPVGYKRSKVEIIVATKTSSGCEEVLQRFTKTTNNNKEFIYIYSYLAACEFPRPEDAQGFTVGSYAGWASDSNKAKSVLIEIGVNGNRVRINSDLEVKQLITTLSGFVPFVAESPKDSLLIK